MYFHLPAVVTFYVGPQKCGLSVEVQRSIPILYDEVLFDEGYRADLIVEKSVLLELKSVETLLPVHAKQVLTYIRLANLHLGYLLNFGEARFKTGRHFALGRISISPNG